jgi:hypothetical protein
MGEARATRWSSDDLWRELEDFRRELEAAGLRKSSIDTYVSRTAVFLRWLNGDYEPRG